MRRMFGMVVSALVIGAVGFAVLLVLHRDTSYALGMAVFISVVVFVYLCLRARRSTHL